MTLAFLLVCFANVYKLIFDAFESSGLSKLQKKEIFPQIFWTFVFYYLLHKIPMYLWCWSLVILLTIFIVQSYCIDILALKIMYFLPFYYSHIVSCAFDRNWCMDRGFCKSKWFSGNVLTFCETELLKIDYLIVVDISRSDPKVCWGH